MLIHYALCDPSYNTGGGNYWTWHAETLPLEMLQKFYREVAAKRLPESPFDLANPHFWDNFVPTTVPYGDWTVIYRFSSGGKDKSNRPGRYIILTAWIKTKEAEGVDLLPIQGNDVFRSVLKNAKTLPVPPPKVLTEIWNIEPKKPDMASSDAFGLSDTGNAFPALYGMDSMQESNRRKASRFSIIVVALTFLLGMVIGVGAGVVLQYSYPVLPLAFQKDDSSNTCTDSQNELKNGETVQPNVSDSENESEPSGEN
jgi:hypothetical protein